MLDVVLFCETLKKNGFDSFSGVPDSLLKEFCLYLKVNLPPDRNIITPNEGNAIALASGCYLATGKPSVVYMQNSGLGNCVNPLTSLADPKVYSIPILLLIGWRGEPGKKDEPQHVKQGEITMGQLDVLGIPYCVLSDDQAEADGQLEKAAGMIHESKSPYAVVIRSDTFGKYLLSKADTSVEYELTREEAIDLIVSMIDESAVFVSSTGKISRELYEIRDKYGMGHSRDFLTVGSMGHSSQIALGIALQKKNRRVVCLDGDGAFIMHMGGAGLIGNLSPENLIHIVLNNGCHESVGGQPTIGFGIDFTAIASACGYNTSARIETRKELISFLKEMKEHKGPVFLDVRVNVSSRDNLGRPRTTPIENKNDFMEFVGK
jgi:phosphonopyruvate decarboxylase